MYNHILVPLDGSELAECVLPHLQAIATGCKVANITLIRVVEPLHLYGGLESRIDVTEKQRLENDATNVAKEYLKKLAKKLEDKEITAQPQVLYGNVLEQLMNHINENEIDLVIIATHGRSGISRLALGSTADKILRSCCVPILMVRAPGCAIEG